MLRIEIRLDVLALGALIGLGYGLLAVGLVLAFRASRVLNLAHGQVGVFAAAVFAVMVEAWGVAYWAALPVAIGVGAVVAAGVELLVVRRLSHVPVLVTVVATLGVAELLRGLGGAVAALAGPHPRVPEPPGIPAFDLGVVRVTPSSTALLVLAPAAVGALAILLARSDLGLRMRAAAANPDAARLTGLPARALRTLAWALAGGLSALTAVLVLPAAPTFTGEALGTPLLLRALAAAVVARLSSAPVALLAGVLIGVLEAVVRWNVVDTALGDVAVVAVLLAALAARRQPWTRGEPAGAWASLEPWVPLPAPARQVPVVRWAPAAGTVNLLGIACALPLVLPGEVEVRLATAACIALLGLSVWVLSGLAGELSLGQVAFAAVGALASAWVVRAGADPALGLLVACGAGAACAVLVGVAGARAGTLGLTVATLAVAVLGEVWLFRQPWAFGDSTAVRPLVLGPVTTDDAAVRYLLAIAALGAALAAVRAVAGAPLGRRLVAARDNPVAARALGLDPAAGRADALAVAGAIAGASGAVLALVLGRVAPSAFPVELGIAAVAVAVVGGLGVAGGALLGALWIAVLPSVVELTSAALAATAFGWLLLLLCAPGGLAAALAPLRGRVVRLLLRAAGHDPALAAPPSRRPPGKRSAAAVLHRAFADGPSAGSTRVPAVLELEGLQRRFGEVVAVDGVDLVVAPGEIVAIVGANGAGKTTLLDLVSGLEQPDAGRVVLDGAEITHAPPHVRARRGLGRSFQAGTLFPTMTVADAVRLAAEQAPGGRAPAAVRAASVLEAFGLGDFADARVRTLSTGLRRLAELACVLAAEPRVLLLDEPASGLAQAEVGALGALLLRIRAATGIGILVVEHDERLVAGVADRVCALGDGRLVGGRAADHVAFAGARA